METLNTKSPASNQSLISKLREEATKNPVFNAVAHAFAVRERARRQVTLNSLARSMRKEGYEFEKDQYAKVLEFLADTGIGTLDLNRVGRPRALKGIRMTLQSIGMAAISGQSLLTRRPPQQRLMKLPSESMPQTFIESPKVAATAVKKNVVKLPPRQKTSEPVKIVVTINGNALTFEIPSGIGDIFKQGSGGAK